MKGLLGKRLVKESGNAELSRHTITGIEDRGNKVAVFNGEFRDVLWKAEANTLAEGCNIIVGGIRMHLE